MSLAQEKMQEDEKLERASRGSEQLEAGFGEDSKVVRGLLRKMDCRYVVGVVGVFGCTIGFDKTEMRADNG